MHTLGASHGSEQQRTGRGHGRRATRAPRRAASARAARQPPTPGAPGAMRNCEDGSQWSEHERSADRRRARRLPHRTPHAACRAEPARAHLALRVTCSRSSRTAGHRQCVRIVHMPMRRVPMSRKRSRATILRVATLVTEPVLKDRDRASAQGRAGLGPTEHGGRRRHASCRARAWGVTGVAPPGVTEVAPPLARDGV